MGKQITIRIYPDGKVESKTQNIKGKACLKYIKPLEQMLEAQVVDSQFTSEYHEAEVSQSVCENTTIEMENRT